MKKLFSMLLCGAMLVSFNACENNEPTDGSNNGSTNSGTNNNGSTDSDSNNGDATTGTHYDHDWVDLGLSYGTLWATCNVGATNPEDYGDYFAWGETTVKENYWWNTYAYYKNYTGLTKYCSFSPDGTVDNRYLLEAADDAATVNWRGDWRMPTKDEQDQLRTQCTWKWTTLNGVNGYKVTSKAKGNTNSIFLPAAGLRCKTSLNAAGLAGHYWSSWRHSTRNEYAYELLFDSDDYIRDTQERCYGYSVRPVYSPK